MDKNRIIFLHDEYINDNKIKKPGKEKKIYKVLHIQHVHEKNGYNLTEEKQ